MRGTCACCLKRRQISALGTLIPYDNRFSIIYPLCKSCLNEGMLHPEHMETVVANVERNIASNSLLTQTRCSYLWENQHSQHLIYRSVKLKVKGSSHLSQKQLKTGGGSE